MKCVATDFALVNNMSARFAEDGIVVRFINFRLADSLLCSFLSWTSPSVASSNASAALAVWCLGQFGDGNNIKRTFKYSSHHTVSTVGGCK